MIPMPDAADVQGPALRIDDVTRRPNPTLYTLLVVVVWVLSPDMLQIRELTFIGH